MSHFLAGLRAVLVVAACVAGVLSGTAGAAEVVQRSEFSTTSRSSSGVLTTKFGSDPLNFKTDGGVWQRVDTALVPAEKGALEVAAVDGSLQIPEDLGSPVVVGHGGQELGLRLRGGAGERGRVSGNEVRFSGVLPGVDAIYAARSTGVKETLVLGKGASRSGAIGGGMPPEAAARAAVAAREAAKRRAQDQMHPWAKKVVDVRQKRQYPQGPKSVEQRLADADGDVSEVIGSAGRPNKRINNALGIR